MRRMMIGCVSSIILDPYTYLLLHMDGANGSTSYIDSSSFSRSVVPTGSTNQSTARYKFGTASSLHDGSGDYLTITGIDFGTGAFCIECWVYPTSSATARYVISYGGTNEAATAGFAVKVEDSFALYATSERITGPALSINQWHHIAIVGNGGSSGNRNIKMYADGTQVGSTFTVDYNFTGKPLLIGANEDATTQCLTGNIDEVRVSVGTQRYTGNFTVPTEPFYT